MDFGFEGSCLHNFLMRTRVEPPQVPENLFSMSFGEAKVWYGDPIFHKHLFLHGFLRKSSFTRPTTPIIPHEETSGMIRIDQLQGTSTWTAGGQAEPSLRVLPRGNHG